MTPVAISRRARLLLAPLSSTLLLVGPVHAAPDSLIEAAPDAGPRTGLKAALPARFNGGVFKFDAQSDESSAEADDEALGKLQADAAAAHIRLHVLVDARDGRLDGERIRAAVPEWREASLWFCGPLGFGETLRRDFAALGFPVAKRFHQELFAMR